jgi:hypothetical protein
MDIEVKLTSIHAALAIVAGAISYLLSTGAISALGKKRIPGSSGRTINPIFNRTAIRTNFR